ncbi:MAG: histidine kinase [Acidobacteria bacterium]|nr:histidine kinase [Acidobacteriota bacterium]
MLRDQLDKLVTELLDKGVLYDDARKEFEKLFIARALQRTDGNLGNAAEMLGVHRNTIARKISEYRLKRTA